MTEPTIEPGLPTQFRPPPSRSAMAAPPADVPAALAQEFKQLLADIRNHDVDDGVSDEELMRMILDRTDKVQGGPPLRTVCVDDETKLIYIRVKVGDLPQWRIIDAEQGDANMFTMEPVILPYRTVFEPPPTTDP